MGEPKARQTEQAKTERDKARSELAVLLKQHQEEIATAWAERIRGLADSSYGDLPLEEVRSLTLRGVQAMADSLEAGSLVVLDEYLAGLCPVDSETVPDASALTEALLLCKDAAVPIIRHACGPDSSTAWALVSALDAFLHWMVGRLTSVWEGESSLITRNCIRFRPDSDHPSNVNFHALTSVLLSETMGWDWALLTEQGLRCSLTCVSS